MSTVVFLFRSFAWIFGPSFRPRLVIRQGLSGIQNVSLADTFLQNACGLTALANEQRYAFKSDFEEFVNGIQQAIDGGDDRGITFIMKRHKEFAPKREVCISYYVNLMGTF